MGEPQKIDEINARNALSPVVHEVLDGYISLTLRW
jgi:hypothetical protein